MVEMSFSLFFQTIKETFTFIPQQLEFQFNSFERKCDSATCWGFFIPFNLH